MNFTIPIGLREAIENDKLVIFVGAGTSTSFKFPSWKGLVLELLERISKRNQEIKFFEPLVSANLMSPLDVLDHLVDYTNEIYQLIGERFKIVPNTDVPLQKKNI